MLIMSGNYSLIWTPNTNLCRNNFICNFFLMYFKKQLEANFASQSNFSPKYNFFFIYVYHIKISWEKKKKKNFHSLCTTNCMVRDAWSRSSISSLASVSYSLPDLVTSPYPGLEGGALPYWTEVYCILYTVHCTLYTVHCTQYTVVHSTIVALVFCLFGGH